jgi:protease I
LKALIIVADGFQDVEAVYPYYRLQEAGYEVTVAGLSGPGTYKGIKGLPFEANAGFDDEAEVIDDYGILVIPGGVKAMEKMRQSEAAIHIVRTLHSRVHSRGCVIASMCSGAQLLISAKIVKGKRIAAYYAMQVDVENAGAVFVDEPAVIDGNIVTSPHYKHLGPWMREVLNWPGPVKQWRESAACAAAL